MNTRWNKFLRELTLLSLFFLPFQNKAKLLYWALADNNSFCTNKRYMNLGYWKNGPTNLDAAGDALAHLLAELANLQTDHKILDVGCGLGDQNRYWLKQFNPHKIVGLNISATQLHQANAALITEQIPLNRISYLEADATQIPFVRDSFDVVFSLEAPFHFNTREIFFAEAFRVLEPGGKFVVTDLINSDCSKLFKLRLMQALGCNFWQVPKANRYTMEIYHHKLQAAGFCNINIRSIWDDVYPPWLEYVKTRIHLPEIKNKFSIIFRNFLATSIKAKQKNRQELMDYILVYAEKPKRAL